MKKILLLRVVLVTCFSIFHAHVAAQVAGALPRALATQGALTAQQLAIVINDDEPNSVAVGEYYQRARNIPEKNVVHVHLPHSPHRLTVLAFEQLKQQIEVQLHPGIQAILMLWTAPYAVECNSITSALSLGYDAEQCKQTCAAGKPSRYYNSSASLPFTELGLRLTMLLPTDTLLQAKALIDRGVISSFALHPASAYLLTTSDANRNSRARFFPASGVIAQKKLQIQNLQRDSIEGAQDVMFYLTGLTHVPKLDSLHFMPGALADHLTSSGGDLLGLTQMSSLRWLENGATASYGTVSEPCNHWQKFPHPGVLLKHYLTGASAIEAYWKSVAWPSQGVFIGEPLATPYRSH